MLFVRVSRTLCEQQYFYHMQQTDLWILKGALRRRYVKGETVRLNANRKERVNDGGSFKSHAIRRAKSWRFDVIS